MITRENLPSHELIGLNAKVVESTNSQIIGLNGLIVDESKSMFNLKTNNGTKKIAKKHNSWEFAIKDGKITIAGKLLAKRPYDRIGVKA